MILQLLFWLSVAPIIYSFAIYPLLLQLLTLWAERRRTASSDPERNCHEWPSVTLVIAAYREESVILERLNNALLLDYPADRFEVVVGVDGHEDLTGDLVASINDSRVRLMQFPERRGKSSVLNDCVPAARGEVIVFSDANTEMAPDAIRMLARHFSDPEVGGVCGKLILTDLTRGRNTDGMYWKYENFLKAREGRLGNLLGANGAIYAIRKSLYDPIPPETIVDDFLIGMRVHLQRLKLLYEPDAQAYEETAPDISGEFRRRARIGAGGFQSLRWLYPLLSPHYGSLALAFWSHKVLRWICPLLMIGALVSNVLLITRPLYLTFMLGQLLFYAVAWLGSHPRLAERLGTGLLSKSVRITTLFVAVNAAFLVGLMRFLSNRQSAKWKRTERSESGARLRDVGPAHPELTRSVTRNSDSVVEA